MIEPEQPKATFHAEIEIEEQQIGQGRAILNCISKAADGQTWGDQRLNFRESCLAGDFRGYADVVERVFEKQERRHHTRTRGVAGMRTV